MNDHCRMVCAVAAVILALGAVWPVMAQQRIPAIVAPEKAPALGNLGGTAAQKVPGSGNESSPKQFIPGNFGRPGVDAANACSFSEVDPKELEAVRKAILDLLSKDAGARSSFLANDRALSDNCPRRKAIFYLQVIARVTGIE